MSLVPTRSWSACLVGLGATLGDAQELLTPLCSGITPDSEDHMKEMPGVELVSSACKVNILPTVLVL